MQGPHLVKIARKKKCGPYTSTYVISIAIIQDQQTQVTHGYTRTFRCVTRTVSYSRGQATGLTHTIVEASIVRKLYSRFVSANAIPLSAASLQFLSFFFFVFLYRFWSFARFGMRDWNSHHVANYSPRMFAHIFYTFF